jgi:hypothetical protein
MAKYSSPHHQTDLSLALLPPAAGLGLLLSAIAAWDFIVSLGSFAATPAHQVIEGGKIRASGPFGKVVGGLRHRASHASVYLMVLEVAY